MDSLCYVHALTSIVAYQPHLTCQTAVDEGNESAAMCLASVDDLRLKREPTTVEELMAMTMVVAALGVSKHL